MFALLLLLPGLAVVALFLAVTQIFEHFISVLVSKFDLLHKPTVHHTCLVFGSPIFRASGMATGYIPGKVGVCEPGDSHFGRWESTLGDRLARRCISRPPVVVMSGW